MAQENLQERRIIITFVALLECSLGFGIRSNRFNIFRQVAFADNMVSEFL